MPVAWFIVPYKTDPEKPRTKYCAIDDFTAQIKASGGAWSEVEVLGNRAIAKVRAPGSVLAALANVTGFKLLPKARLDDELWDLSPTVKAAIKDELLDAGYSLSEITTRFDRDLGNYTLRDVLRFMATRRLKQRYDEQSQTIVLDGPPQACESIDKLDRYIKG